MTLIWMWVREFRSLEDKAFCFSSKYNIKWNRTANEIQISASEWDPTMLYRPSGESTMLSALSVIVGPNGSGKSSVAALLFSDPEYIARRHEVIFIYSDSRKGTFYAFYSTPDRPTITAPEGMVVEQYPLAEVKRIVNAGRHLMVYDSNAYLGQSLEENCKRTMPNARDISTPKLSSTRSNYQRNMVLSQLSFISQVTGDLYREFIPFEIPKELSMSWSIAKRMPKPGQWSEHYTIKCFGDDLIEQSRTLILYPGADAFQVIIGVFQFEACMYVCRESFGHEDRRSVQQICNGVDLASMQLNGKNPTIEKIYNKISAKARKLFGDYFERVDALISWIKGIWYEGKLLIQEQSPDLEDMIEWESTDSGIVWRWRLRGEGSRQGEIIEFIRRYFTAFSETPIFDFSWKMSSGEECLFNIFAKYYQFAKTVEIKGAGRNLKDMLLFVDEADIYLHPRWQQDYLCQFIRFLHVLFEGKKIRRLQLIFTTHSPIMLSDVAKRNVIFLGGDEKEHRETFAANIHSLFYDSFFLKEGSMGLIARGWIEALVRYCWKEEENDEDDDDDWTEDEGNSEDKWFARDDFDLSDARNIARIIGEQIIGNRIQDVLNAKEESAEEARERDTDQI